MNEIVELRRLPSPAPLPQALAFDGTSLWMGSRETRRMYAIDPATWSARDEGDSPGTPWGAAVAGDELFVICGEGEDDTRVIRTFIPGRGFMHRQAIPCPDDTGSHLSYDGDRLYVSQWYNRKIVSIDGTGKAGSVIEVPHGIAGHVIVDGCFYAITTDDEEQHEYFVTRIDARGSKPVCTDIATLHFDARALAWDGERFWTNHRDANEIVCFARPDAA